MGRKPTLALPEGEHTRSDSLAGRRDMKCIVSIFAVLLLGGCTATSPQYIAQKQAEVLAKAEAICSTVKTQKGMACLNRVVHQSGYWGQGLVVVAASGGSPRLV